MWLAHYSFHFFTSYATLLPVSERIAQDFGLTALGPPHWNDACCVPVAEWLLRLEIVFLDLGLLLSLYTAYRITKQQVRRFSEGMATIAPWAAVIVLLFTLGIWIVFQPMQMRGTLPSSY